MAPLIKDAVEVSNPAPEVTAVVSPAPPAPAAKPSSGGMRAEALSLDVAVKVHGSRVKEVVRGITPHTEPFEEQTNTMIVFPQGGVVRMTTPVNAGQMMVITNLKTRQDAICRVVKIRANASQQSYVEVEFTSRQPGYWGVNFPSDGPSAVAMHSPTPAASPVAAPPEATNAVPPVALPNPAAPVVKPFETTVSTSGVQPYIMPPAPAKPVMKPQSTFISIGSQEDVQVSASSTMTAKPPAPVLEPFGAPRHTREAAKPSAPAVDIAAISASLDAVAPMAPPTSISMEELRGDSSPSLAVHEDEPNAPPHPAAAELNATETHSAETQESSESSASPLFSPSSARPRSSFGSFGGGTSLTLGHTDSSETLGARFESSVNGSLSAPAALHQNWVLIAACVAVLFVAVAGGIYYFRSLKSGNSAARSIAASAPSVPSGVLATQQPLVPGGAASGSNAVVPPAQTPPASVNAPAQSVPVVADEKKVPASFASARPAAKPAPPVTNDMVASTLNAHPVAAQHDSAADGGTAPSYDAASDAQSESLSGAIPTSSNINVPEPKIQPDGPVKIGGQVKEARLVSSVNPTYPAAAKEAGVQGDVVINAVIDKTGHVRQMKVVSGPILLRQSALNAMREWRYSPSTLDGQPIDGQVVVTLQFRK